MGLRPRVGAVLDDPGDGVSEARPDVLEALAPAVVFGRVVEERRDRLVFAAAVIEYDRHDAHEVADVRCARALARLRAMDLVRVAEGLVESGW